MSKKGHGKPHVKPAKSLYAMRHELAVRPDDSTTAATRLARKHDANAVGIVQLTGRAREHALRYDGAAQMAVFLSCIDHLPRLPRDIVNLLRQLVCGVGDAVYLIGGVLPSPPIRDPEVNGYKASQRVLRLQNSVLTEVASLPVPLCGASAVYYEGEILVVGGYSSEAAEYCYPTFLYPVQSPSDDIWIYNIADDEWRAVPAKASEFGHALSGCCSASVYKHVVFVCGESGFCSAIDARTMTRLRMPQRYGKVFSTHMQTAIAETGLLICWGSAFDCERTVVEYRSVEADSLSKCCCSLHVLDARAFVENPEANIEWIELPVPPVWRGHVRPDATMFVRGSSIYLVGGTNAFETTCCPRCSSHETTDVHRVLDLAQNNLAWRFDNLQSGKGCAMMHAKQLRSGEVLLIGGMDASGRFEAEAVLDGALLSGVVFEGALFASATVPVME